jgi:hypothetical protein
MSTILISPRAIWHEIKTAIRDWAASRGRVARDSQLTISWATLVQEKRSCPSWKC